jgi:hypothetical protein
MAARDVALIRPLNPGSILCVASVGRFVAIRSPRLIGWECNVYVVTKVLDVFFGNLPIFSKYFFSVEMRSLLIQGVFSIWRRPEARFRFKAIFDVQGRVLAVRA